LPLHCSAAGKLLLADRFAHGKPLPLPRLEKLTDNTIVDHAALEIELARVRQQGWSAAPEEMVLGVNAISAPIYSQRSELVGMISIVGSIQFISRQPSRDLIDAVTRAAKDISALLSL
jgi:DNA-binding IclR family transcriptional regulator